jgi:uncharacterized coiled-coil DUF342 family protein
MKETNEEFRDIFTYTNFKRTIVENQEMKEEIQEIKAENQEMREDIQEIRAENQEMRTKVEQLMDFMHRAEDL